MTNDETHNEPDTNELPADISAALRDLTPATDAVREAHLATALGAIAPRSRRRMSPISVAASIVLVLAVGATLFARTGKNAAPALAAHAITPYVPVKGATPEQINRTVGANSCMLAGTDIFGFYTMDTQIMKLGWSAKEISVINGDSCVVVGELPHLTDRPVLTDAETKTCAAAPVEDAVFLAETSEEGYAYQVLATNTELLLLDCATASITQRIAHPSPEVPLYP